MLAIVLLALWQAAASWTRGIAIAPPLGTVTYLADLVQTAMFWGHVGATAAALLLAFGLSAVIGLGLGLLLGLRHFAAEVVEPILAGSTRSPR